MAVHNRKIVQKISHGLSSRYPLIYIQGWEEDRIERLLNAVAASYYGESGRLVAWSATRGFEATGAAGAANTDPLSALVHIAEQERPGMYLMKDLPGLFADNPILVRALRDLYYRLKNKGAHVFMTYPELVLPEVLKKEVFLVEMDLPSEEEILDGLRDPQGTAALAEADMYRLAGAMRGLSLNEVAHLRARIFRDGGIDISKALEAVYEEKSQLLRKESCLRYYPPQRAMKSVGGLRNLKDWVLKRKDLFSEAAYEAGIPLPSGILLMGVSGCGKSMAAKAIAATWQLPLVRLDMSLIVSGSYGTPEYAFERAIRTAEGVAPIVLWIDEVENAFGYDEKVAGRQNVNIFSSFLTWLQEKSPKVFVAATANRIEELPAELMRKGRFDQLFFLDLPTKEERIEIFRIHVEINGGSAAAFNLGYLAEVAKDWSGAEIEQAVKSARVNAYQSGRKFNEADVVDSLSGMVPLSRTMTEQIKAIRDWSYTRAVPASEDQK